MIIFASMKEERSEKYETLCAQIDSLIAGEHHRMGVLANVTAALHDAFPERFFWVGFYLVADGALQLGPFQGPVACYRIAKGRGVCGTAWDRAETVVVEDVDRFPGHIACSSLSRSEVVVPLRKMVPEVNAREPSAACEVVGVLDIDSRELAAFDATDAFYLEKIVKNICNRLEF